VNPLDVKWCVLRVVEEFAAVAARGTDRCSTTGHGQKHRRPTLSPAQPGEGDVKLQRRVFLVFPLQRDCRLFEIELALDAAAGFVGDLPLLQ
jgi:hypothetical protein